MYMYMCMSVYLCVCVYLLFFNKPNQVGKRQHTKAQRQILFCQLGARLAGVIYSFYSQLLKTAQRCSWQIKYDKIRKQQRENERKEGKPEKGEGVLAQLSPTISSSTMIIIHAAPQRPKIERLDPNRTDTKT